jgi:hypothetical protein
MADLVSRRRMISISIAAGSAVTLSSLALRSAKSADAPATVDEKDQMAVALGYVSDAKRVDAKTNPSYQAGAACAACSWYQGKAGDSAGPCTFFPGKLVAAGGWCKMWSKKQK